MSGSTTGRHRLGRPDGVPVRSLVRVRRSLFSWFRPGRHRATTSAVRAPHWAPATV